MHAYYLMQKVTVQSTFIFNINNTTVAEIGKQKKSEWSNEAMICFKVHDSVHEDEYASWMLHE